MEAGSSSRQFDVRSALGILASDLEKRITEAFEIFDHGGNKCVDVREIGTILRSLGCCPTEAEIQEILVKVEDHETSSVYLGAFLPVITQIITARKLQPATPEELLKAFHTIDKERKGYISKECLSKLITEEGEPFTREELDEFLSAAADSETGNIHYEYYLNQIIVHTEKPQYNVYALIPTPPDNKPSKLLPAILEDL